ncbi:uncharacterized protein LOC117536475 [Gymnodraco acuticeps]|uniref:Uncharacterized protein LOC117536475 n=1 Tax=Gymnodraco acuticeps TaxID=8218 RepID=A0A6P8T1B6_GYMAC|nr:uncharacterized protein LOC117536475 [Gymnodraco acuticeps]
MSNSDSSEDLLFSKDLDPVSDTLSEEASNSVNHRRSSSRLSARSGSRSAEAEFLVAHLKKQGITPAPDLLLSQLREQSDQASGAVSQPRPAAPASPPGRGRGRARGGKRPKKASPPGAHSAKKSSTPQAHSSGAQQPSTAQPGSSGTQPPFDGRLANTLQSLASSMLLIDARLQSMERGQAGASTSSAAPLGQDFTSGSVAPSYSLASALPAPPSGRPYIPQAANISSRLRAKILDGKDINLVSLILPSPECDKAIATGGSITAYLQGGPPEGSLKGSGVPDKPNRGRYTVDLSAPRAGPFCSINSLIPPEYFSLHYASVDNAIKLIKFAGQGAWLSKADITDAFKIIPIHPSQWHMFGIRWESKFYFAVRLTFGCRSSPCIFNSFSEALCWILLNIVRIPSVLHLLDDFLLIDPPRDNSGDSLAKLKTCFQELGVPLSEEKTLGPNTCLEFLGITLDSVDMEASLPTDKLQRIRDISKAFCEQQVITKQQLLSLLGHLNFAMRIIPQGRSFISRLLDTASAAENLHDHVFLDEGCRSDLRFWSLLLVHWNGVTFFYDDLVYSSDSMRFFTDAAPSVGFGFFFQGEWFAGSWPPSFPSHASSSALHEIFPIAVACHVWGHLWPRKRISVLCDNQSVVGIINKARSPCRDIMPFMRSITWSSITHNFLISARHVPGHLKSVADSLSRFQFQTFRNLCPGASAQPVRIPPLHLLSLS